MPGTGSVLSLSLQPGRHRGLVLARVALATVLDLDICRSGASAGPDSSKRINGEALKTSGGTWMVAAKGFQQRPPWGRVCPHKAVSTCLNWPLISRH